VAPGPDQPDPLALGAYWGRVRPFVLWSADQFRAPAPPALASLPYTTAFYEVKLLGGDGVVTPTVRTGDQTFTGIYWGYDGTPGLGTPPRMYNQITVHIADQMGSNAVELARLLALVNVAIADAGIAIWESKYYYQFWRPVTAIREAGPLGADDGNAATIGDPTFTPSARRPAISTGRTSRRPSRPIPQGMPGSGPLSSKSCATSTGPTTSPSPSCRTNSTA